MPDFTLGGDMSKKKTCPNCLCPFIGMICPACTQGGQNA